MESPEKGTGGTPVTGSIEPVAVAVAVFEPVRDLASGIRGPGSGVRLLQRDQVNPVTVSVTVSVSVTVTGSEVARARPFDFHASTGGPWSMG